jgi:prepilin peptidase CpaA
MSDFDLISGLRDNWPTWLVTVTLIVAAVIDGWMLKVPNWLTFPMIVSGWVFGAAIGGWQGLGYSLAATALGLALLLPAYAIGGMGAGDVKLLAGVGAWMGSTVTFFAFCTTAIVGGVMAVAMVLLRGAWKKHRDQFVAIFAEVVTIRDPQQLAVIAAERKPTMMLLPYGIPIALGTILYFAWNGMLV